MYLRLHITSRARRKVLKLSPPTCSQEYYDRLMIRESLPLPWPSPCLVTTALSPDERALSWDGLYGISSRSRCIGLIIFRSLYGSLISSSLFVSGFLKGVIVEVKTRPKGDRSLQHPLLFVIARSNKTSGYARPG